MKTALITICIGEEYKNLAKLTHPTFLNYANKFGLDFIIIDSKSNYTPTPHWEKFQIANYLKTYDRIIYLDTDVIIKKDCENLLEIVPSDKVGLFNESSIEPQRIDDLKYYLNKINIDNLNVSNTYNTGVMVISKGHEMVFEEPIIIAKHIHFEQPHLNYNILKNNIPVFTLDYKYNRMITSKDYYDSGKIIHYAGIKNEIIYNLIKQDLEKYNNAT